MCTIKTQRTKSKIKKPTPLIHLPLLNIYLGKKPIKMYIYIYMKKVNLETYGVNVHEFTISLANFELILVEMIVKAEKIMQSDFVSIECNIESATIITSVSLTQIV